MNEGQVAANRQSEIVSELEQLEGASMHMRELADRLFEKLGPVMRPQEPSVGKDPPCEPPGAPMAHRLWEIRNNLMIAGGSLGSILGHLEV